MSPRLNHPRLRLAAVLLNLGVLLLVIALWSVSYPTVSRRIPLHLFGRLWTAAHLRHASFLYMYMFNPDHADPPFGLAYPVQPIAHPTAWGLTLVDGQFSINIALTMLGAPFHISSGRRPVFRAMRAIIRGPISTAS